jgi:hypothetical protein
MKKGIVCQGKGIPMITDLYQVCFEKMAGCGFQGGGPEERGVGKAKGNKKGPFLAGPYHFKILIHLRRRPRP